MSYLSDFPGSNNDDNQERLSSNADTSWQADQLAACLPTFQSENVENDPLDMEVDERDDDWLKWDGTMTAMPSLDSRRQNTGNSFYGNEASGTGMVSNPGPGFRDGMLGGGASFGLTEPNQTLPFPFQPFSYLESDDSGILKSEDQTMSNSGRTLYAYSTLSAGEERRLRGIAMPNHTFPEAAPSTAKKEEDESPVLETVKPRGRPRGLKRKSLTREDQQKMFQNRKQSHNTVEKRYRLNLNDKIELLRCSIPKFNDTITGGTLMDGDGDGDGDAEEEPDSTLASRPGKAAVLAGAVEYISELESSTKRLAAETAALKTRLAAFEKLAIGGSIFTGDVGPQDKPPPPT